MTMSTHLPTHLAPLGFNAPLKQPHLYPPSVETFTTTFTHPLFHPRRPTSPPTYLPTTAYHPRPTSIAPNPLTTLQTLPYLPSPPPRARFYIRLHHVHPLRPCISVTYASDVCVCVSMYGICMYIYTESSILKWRNSGRYRAARYRYTRYIRIYVHGVSGMGDASPSSPRYIRYNA